MSGNTVVSVLHIKKYKKYLSPCPRLREPRSFQCHTGPSIPTIPIVPDPTGPYPRVTERGRVRRFWLRGVLTGVVEGLGVRREEFRRCCWWNVGTPFE